MIVSDGDGTLLNTNREIAVNNLEAIRYFADNGGMFVFATGRPMAGAKHIRKNLPAGTPSIYFNGALIYDHLNESVLFSDPLPPGMGKVAEFLTNEYPQLGLESFTMDKAYVIKDGPVTQYHIHILHVEADEQTVNQVPDEGLLKMFCTGEKALILKAWESLQEKFPGMFNVLPSGDNFLEIFSSGSTKGTAVKMLREHYSEYSVNAVGDNYNDIAMFEQADRAFIPANGVEKAKRYGVEVCSCNEGALADVVNYLEKHL